MGDRSENGNLTAPKTPTDFGESIAGHLDNDAIATGERWWNGPHADFILDVAAAGPFIVALAGLIDVLRDGKSDPRWVLGTTTPKAACRLAREWIDAKVDPAEVADWLRAGCCEPRWARSMARAGIDPKALLDADGMPRHIIDKGPDSDGLPLARAVAEEYVAVGWAVKYLASAEANGVG